jgi:molybdopterin-guanine dinucleotide biosynthesis protein A
MKYNVIIPMAGEGSRFSYTFKPFIKLDDRTFIEHVMDSFTGYEIVCYYFIITMEQEQKYKVKNSIDILFPMMLDKIKIIYLENKTEGPYQTITNGIKLSNPIENVFICDCDHKIIIEPMISLLEQQRNQLDNHDFDGIKPIPDILIPIWNINKHEYCNWGKLIINDENKIINYYEKETNLEENQQQQIYGMIGCYFFKTTEIFDYHTPHINMSDFFKTILNQVNINICKIEQAYFFGTPKMVDDYIDTRRNYENIICDIDGVLIKHHPNSNNNSEDNVFLSNGWKKIEEWKKQHKKIILMTSRSKNTRNGLEKLLKENHIYYDELIMGVNPGTRYVINDIKPSHLFTKQAVAINIVRNDGIDNLICNENTNNQIKIIKILKGGSFSKNYLLELNGQKYVRKYIIKSPETMEHYIRLKRQCEDLKRFNYYSEALVPKILNEQDSSYDYYYDMAYLENYEQLDCFEINIQQMAVLKIMENLNRDVYCYKKTLNENEQNKFMDDYMQEKIYCKLDKFEKECKVMDYLINQNEIRINGKQYYGLKEIIQKINVYNYKPGFVCPIHGDLNYENILYNEKIKEVITIDMEGSRYVDTPFFDLGKLFQSVVSKYEIWSKMEQVMINDDIHHLQCIGDFFDYHDGDISFLIDIFKQIFKIEDGDFLTKAGIFYMSNYFIRFIPFRLKVGKKHGIFAMIMAIVWLNKLST